MEVFFLTQRHIGHIERGIFIKFSTNFKEKTISLCVLCAYVFKKK